MELLDTIGLSYSASTIVITLLVARINYYAQTNIVYGSKSWDLVEWAFATLFGWIAVVYILITYPKYIFGGK